MGSKTEVMQTIMLAASESNFFASAPVIAHQIERAQRLYQPIDLLISGFTVTGMSLLLSERFGIPVSGFSFQPTCIRSKVPGWRNIEPIESHTLFHFIDRTRAPLERQA